MKPASTRNGLKNWRIEMGRCKDYVGVACVDGSCPKANAEEYAERCMDVISDCDD